MSREGLLDDATGTAGHLWAVDAVTRGLLHRAAHILDVLAAAEQPLSIRAIAEQAELSKSAVQRILAELVATELASQEATTKRYRLGPRTLALGMAYQRRVDVRRAALPHMRGLRDATGETIGISVGLADQLLHVDQVESESPLHARFDIGRPLPLWSGAPARLFLAVRDDEEIRRIVTERAGTDLTPVNPPSPDALVHDVQAVRAAGHACAFEETLPGVNTMSVPVRGSHGELAAVLSLTAPSTRLPRERVDELMPAVVACAQAISADLGWMGSDQNAQVVPMTA
jgi:IclR family acetate operon transcriptional repressor